jgi:hypothetical protein
MLYTYAHLCEHMYYNIPFFCYNTILLLFISFYYCVIVTEVQTADKVILFIRRLEKMTKKVQQGAWSALRL